MEYKDIASVTGKGGLFKVIKPTRTGVILESLDDQRKKMVASASQRISVLSDISIYTTDQEGSKPLDFVMHTIYEEFGEDTGLGSSADNEELRAFLKHILPEYDEQRVYPSDIKKLLNWYRILYKEAPELLKETPVEEKEDKKEEDKAADS